MLFAPRSGSRAYSSGLGSCHMYNAASPHTSEPTEGTIAALLRCEV